MTACTLGFLGTNFFMFLRFFFPRTLFEPKTVFRIGYPSDFGFGVDTKFQKDYRIWVVRNAEGLFVIYARCTHLGCTPDWKSSENKFKCPCHGSGYDTEGVNFEGPAPRPHGPGQSGAGRRRTDCCGYQHPLRLAQGRPLEVQRSGSLLTFITNAFNFPKSPSA